MATASQPRPVTTARRRRPKGTPRAPRPDAPRAVTPASAADHDQTAPTTGGGGGDLHGCCAARVPEDLPDHEVLTPDLARDVRRLLAQLLVADMTAYPMLVAEDTPDGPVWRPSPAGIEGNGLKTQDQRAEMASAATGTQSSGRRAGKAGRAAGRSRRG